MTSSHLYLAQVMAYKLKLASPGGETRLLTFSDRPSWLDVQSKVVSYFSIQKTAVAVSYEDSDGDIVTMNSQEELQDYLQSCYKAGQIGKLTVVDKSRNQHPTQKKESAFAEDLGEELEEGIPTMGPTMFIEVDDGGWQRVPHIPEIYSVREEDGLVDSDGGHAFVEVVDSDAESGKKGSQATSPEQTSDHGIATRQIRRKGKGKAYSASEATKSTSSASVVDDDFPTKPSVHVYDVSDNGRSPWSTAQGLPDQEKRVMFGGGPNIENLVGSFGTVYPTSPQDAFKGMPQATDLPSGMSTTGQSDSFHSGAQPSAGPMPSSEYEGRRYEFTGTDGSRTPTLEQMSSQPPSFVHDVANLVDNLTAAFASHPELSEGARNIVRNAVGGRYWNSEHDRVVNAAERVAVVSEETASRISHVAGSMAINAERDAVRMIAEALAGGFRVISELSGSENVEPRRDRFDPPPGPPPLHRPPPPFRSHGPPGEWRGPPPGRGPLHSPYHTNYRGPGVDVALSGPNAFDSRWRSRETAQQPERASTWVPGLHPPHYSGAPYNEPLGEGSRPNVHETKAHLEAAKAVYKAEKERFRREKEERRRLRREAQGTRIQHPDGTIREEEIIARLPLHGNSSNKRPHGESDHIPTQSSTGADSVKRGSHDIAVPTVTQTISPRAGGTRTSIYSSVDPIPPVPPVPFPAPTNIVPPIPPPPPAPPAHPSACVPLRPAPTSSLSTSQAPPVSLQHRQGTSAPAPYPWPMPPARDPSRRAHLTTLRERIMARLFDMGITAASQPDMMEILNECTSRADAPNEEEVLADVLSAMNIRGSPSPRVANSKLSY